MVPFAITEETSSTHHYHLNPGWILAFTPGIIYSLCLDKFKVTCTHHCVSTHSNFSSLKCFFLCLLTLSYSQSLQTMDIIKYLHSFVFSWVLESYSMLLFYIKLRLVPFSLIRRLSFFNIFTASLLICFSTK